MSLVPLHDPRNGVVVALKCFEMHDEHLEPENIDFCATLKAKYDDFDYKDLMNTTFGVVPAGRSPATFRLAEVSEVGYLYTNSVEHYTYQEIALLMTSTSFPLANVTR